MLDIIKDLVKSNPGQLSIDEYTKIYDTIKKVIKIVKFLKIIIILNEFKNYFK